MSQESLSTPSVLLSKKLTEVKLSTYIIYLESFFKCVLESTEDKINSLRYKENTEPQKRNSDLEKEIKNQLKVLWILVLLDNKKESGALTKEEEKIVEILSKYKYRKKTVAMVYIGLSYNNYFNRIYPDGFLQGGLPGSGKRRR